ncbi:MULTISPECIES: hypothetical protein [Lentzea]|uniref:hypothetical protein n=1 Tax=Lentzea TaxID=165301 RepID=UPI0004C3B03E|nr:hypothetical protein [Lentzea aerocolonigenes]MCP2242514.1 hypothetical protein [Lentzea aerocolonigenes]
MRVTALVVFMRLIGAGGVGAYVGAAASGLIAVLTGKVFAPGSPWTTGLPFLIVIGAVLTMGIARLTRAWFLPAVATRRILWGAAAGAVLLPLAVAVGELGDLAPIAVGLMAIGWVTTVVLWIQWFRRRSSHSPRRRASERAR